MPDSPRFPAPGHAVQPHGDTQAEAFAENGFCMITSLVEEADCAAIADRIALLDDASAGCRNLLSEPWCATLAATLRQSPRLSPLIDPQFVAVQCTYFEKSRARNWIVPVHQDLSIPVLEKVDSPHLSGWSEKEGQVFVQAPADLLRALVAVRLHLDPCLAGDGPVRVFRGSHRLDRIQAAAAAAAKSQHEEVMCTAAVGSALVMSPLILHASSKAHGNSRRRVLHFLYGPRALPFGLTWPRSARA